MGTGPKIISYGSRRDLINLCLTQGLLCWRPWSIWLPDAVSHVLEKPHHCPGCGLPFWALTTTSFLIKLE